MSPELESEIVTNIPDVATTSPRVAEGHFVAGVECEILWDVEIRERRFEGVIAARHRRILIQHGL